MMHTPDKPGFLSRLLDGVQSFVEGAKRTVAGVATTIGIIRPAITGVPAVEPPTTAAPLFVAGGQGQMFLLIGAVVLAVVLFAR